MPNWCENDLYVRGTKEELAKFKEAVKGTNHQGEEVLITEEKIIPYPDKFKELDRVAAEYHKAHPAPEDYFKGPKDGFNQGGYEWCNENWGTKWGFGNVELRSEEDQELEYGFETAWAPPEPLIKKLGEMFPQLEFELKYFEAGAGYSGVLRIVKGKVVEEHSGEYSGSRGG